MPSGASSCFDKTKIQRIPTQRKPKIGRAGGSKKEKNGLIRLMINKLDLMFRRRPRIVYNDLARNDGVRNCNARKTRACNIFKRRKAGKIT